MESDARGAGGGGKRGGGGGKGREDLERHARLLQRIIEELEERAAWCKQAGEAALRDCRLAGEELVAKGKELDRKKLEWGEARARRRKFEVVKEEARRKED